MVAKTTPGPGTTTGGGRLSNYSDAGDTVAAAKVTDANGNYLFTGMPPGGYVARILAPPAGTNTGNPPGGAANPVNEGAATLVLNGAVLGVDFGYQSATTGSIGDQVFHDLNTSGTPDLPLEALAGVTVTAAVDTNDDHVPALMFATASDASGFYRFIAIPEGAGVFLTVTTNAGGNWSISVPPGPTTADSDPGIDFGFACYGTWQEWQFVNPLGGNNQPGDNPDGDRHDNLIEYAFHLPPDSGAGTPFSLKVSTISTSRMEFSEVVSEDAAALVVRDLTPLGGGAPKRFMRLHVKSQ